MAHLPRVSSPLRKPSPLDFEESVCEEETSPKSLYMTRPQRGKQDPGPEDTRHINLQVKSYEAFKAAVSAIRHTPAQKQTTLTLVRRGLGIEPKKPPEDLHGEVDLMWARDEVKYREQRKKIRLKAALRVQKWWRRVLILRKNSPDWTRFHSFLNSILKNRIKDLISVVKQTANSRLQQQILYIKYVNACAGVIQREWRRHRGKIKWEKENRRKMMLLAAIRGWKTRKIMKSWAVSGVKIRMKDCKKEEKGLLVVELIQTFRDEYRCGKWMRKPKVSHAVSVPRNQASRHTRQSASISPQPTSVSPVSATSPVKPETIKPFLKRKTRTIAPQKVSWTQVKTRVNCWGDITSTGEKRKQTAHTPPPVTTRNSLEEFIAIERISLKGNASLPVPQKRVLLKSHTQPYLSKLASHSSAGSPVKHTKETMKLLTDSDDETATNQSGGQGTPRIRLKLDCA